MNTRRPDRTLLLLGWATAFLAACSVNPNVAFTRCEGEACPMGCNVAAPADGGACTCVAQAPDISFTSHAGCNADTDCCTGTCNLDAGVAGSGFAGTCSSVAGGDAGLDGGLDAGAGDGGADAGSAADGGTTDGGSLDAGALDGGADAGSATTGSASTSAAASASGSTTGGSLATGGASSVGTSGSGTEGTTGEAGAATVTSGSATTSGVGAGAGASTDGTTSGAATSAVSASGTSGAGSTGGTTGGSSGTVPVGDTCAACTVDSDCASATDWCIADPSFGSYCAPDCATEPCASGYACTRLTDADPNNGAVEQVCYPTAGTCAASGVCLSGNCSNSCCSVGSPLASTKTDGGVLCGDGTTCWGGYWCALSIGDGGGGACSVADPCGGDAGAWTCAGTP